MALFNRIDVPAKKKSEVKEICPNHNFLVFYEYEKIICLKLRMKIKKASLGSVSGFSLFVPKS